jgi:hypothetical protein
LKALLHASIVAALLLPAAGAGAQSEASLTKGGAWPTASHSCVRTKVTQTGSRLQGAPDSGSTVEFASSLGLAGFKGMNGSPLRAGIVSYDSIPVVVRERAGDLVQLCLASVPKADQYCNPSKDSRGRMYRVYDYRQQKAYAGANSEHSCGGA